MKWRRKTTADLRGLVIDGHAHAGVSIKNYCLKEYPYAETVESLYHKQLAGGVDATVVFPFTPELYCDIRTLVDEGRFVRAENPFSPVPYQVENELLLREVYDFCPELTDRFLPFVCFDPGRDQSAQIAVLEELSERYPIYGIKIVSVLCQTSVLGLLDSPEFFTFAAERNLPVLFHSTSQEADPYSNAGDILKVVDAHPELRYCLAHCIIFHDGYLRDADARPNVWVDTAALKIQVEAFRQGPPFASENPEDWFEADYSDHRHVICALAEAFPDTLIWGTDSPAYSYIVRRQSGEDGSFMDFKLKGTYADEVAARDALPAPLARKVASENTLQFVFGRDALSPNGAASS